MDQKINLGRQLSSRPPTLVTIALLLAALLALSACSGAAAPAKAPAATNTAAVPDTGSNPTLAAAPVATVTLPPTEAEDAAPGTQPASPAIECASPAALTPAMTEGPYYKANTPETTVLADEQAGGTHLFLTGYVLTQDCQPVANAFLDFWQTDAEGQYDNAGYGMRGHQYTDEHGRYTLESVVPGIYPGRTAHIHVKVQAPGGPMLTTQLYFPGEAGNQSDRIFSPELLVDVQDQSGGTMQATYNFVVETQ